MWSAGTRLTISVDLSTFNYTAAIQGGTPWLVEGAVALQCGGERYATNSGKALVGSGATEKISGQDATLGSYQGVERAWRAGSCAELLTTIRYYSELDAFDFLTRVGSGGANGTATSPLSVRQAARLGQSIAINTSTEFPSFVLPPSGSAAGLGFVSWNGDALLGMHQLERPAGPGSGADFGRWTGGLVSGPLLMFANGSSPSTRADALMLGASSAFKVGVLSRSGTRLVAGAQGMIKALPPGYELRFTLAGGAGVGVTAAAYSWGRVLRRSHGAAPTAAKLTLADDVLSRALHYETDGGAAENYCDYWPMCTNASSPQWPCEPMGRTLARLDAYHRSLALNVSLYHLDPFWWSNEPFGGCAGGSSAVNLSASPFHFPAGLAAVGLPTMLIVKFFAAANVYNAPPFDVRFRGLSVGADDAPRFWRARLDELVGAADLRALVWDGLDSVWLSDDARVDNTDEQAAADRAFADAALARGLPIRMDTAAAGDLLASVARGAHTVSRCTADAVPHAWFEANRWVQLGDNSLLLAALGLRPMVDVLWTNATQAADPRWADGGSSRPNMAHDAITAVLSTGPVGFGDLIGATDASLLARTSRADGAILKPAAPALRLERYYTALGGPGAEVWVAPAGPAASADPRTDERANARLDLGAVAAAAAARPSWWCVLATNVDGSSAAGRPVATSELWPAPPDGAAFLVATVERRAADRETGVVGVPPQCEDGQPARSCLALWDASTPLGVGTGAPPSAEVHAFVLFLAAPLLPSGWVLLGELGGAGRRGRYVPASPQRLLMGDADAHDDAALRFGVVGAAAEAVQLTLVAPAIAMATSATTATSTRIGDAEGASPLDGLIVVLHLTLGASGAANVSCVVDACTHVAF